MTIIMKGEITEILESADCSRTKKKHKRKSHEIFSWQNGKLKKAL